MDTVIRIRSCRDTMIRCMDTMIRCLDTMIRSGKQVSGSVGSAALVKILFQVGVWHEQYGITFTRNFTESLQEIVESLQNKTLVVTTIRVRDFLFLSMTHIDNRRPRWGIYFHINWFILCLTVRHIENYRELNSYDRNCNQPQLYNKCIAPE